MSNVSFQDPDQEQGPVCEDPGTTEPGSSTEGGGSEQPAQGPAAGDPNNPLLACLDPNLGGKCEEAPVTPASDSPETCEWNSGVPPAGLNCPPGKPPVDIDGDHLIENGVEWAHDAYEIFDHVIEHGTGPLWPPLPEKKPDA